MELCVFTEPQQGATYDDLLELVLAAQAGGFHAYFRSDHYRVMGAGDGLPGPTDAWVHLAGLARDTDRIRLGTLVSPATFRLPGVLALQVAQVDAMSGGRVELGLGAGWFAAEHAAFGIPFPDVHERFDRLEEQLQIVTGLWSTPQGERYGFAGRHYSLTDSPALPKPVQRPVPLIIGGSGKRRTPELAARYASEFNIGFCSLEEAAARYDRVRQACRTQGRDPATLALSWAGTTLVGRDGAELARRAAATGADVAQLRRTGLAGTPGEVVDRIAALAALGAGRIYLQLMDLRDLDQVALIAAEVLPAVC